MYQCPHEGLIEVSRLAPGDSRYRCGICRTGNEFAVASLRGCIPCGFVICGQCCLDCDSSPPPPEINVESDYYEFYLPAGTRAAGSLTPGVSSLGIVNQPEVSLPVAFDSQMACKLWMMPAVDIAGLRWGGHLCFLAVITALLHTTGLGVPLALGLRAIMTMLQQ